ncbi:TPA: toxin YdaT family protein [Serratia marcescens]
MQNIFRWLDSGSRKAKVKIEALKPAILKALEQRRYGTIQYQVARAQKEFAEAVSAALLELPEADEEINDAIEALHVLRSRPHSGIYCRGYRPC